MKKLFSRREFVPDTMYIRVLQVVADKPHCVVSYVVAMLLPEHDTWDVRSGIHQLVLRRYLCEGSSNKEICLSISETGRELLLKSTPE
jgi:hypothetical protein